MSCIDTEECPRQVQKSMQHVCTEVSLHKRAKYPKETEAVYVTQRQSPDREVYCHITSNDAISAKSSRAYNGLRLQRVRSS